MIEQIRDLNGVYELFRSYNGLGNENCFFYMVTEDPIDFKTIAKGVVLGVALNAVYGNSVHGARNAARGLVIGANADKNTENTSHFSGYLVNQTENGIGLIPLENEHSTDTIEDMKIVPNSYLFINQNDIKSVKIEQKNIYFLDPSIRIVTFEFSNGQKVVFRVYAKSKYVKYQESNFSNFMNRYGVHENKKSDLIRKVARFLFLGLILSMIVIFIISVVIALKSSTNSNDSSLINEVDTGKIKVDKYNP